MIEDLQETYPGAGTFKFGQNAAQSRRLLKLVRKGKKSANSEAFRDFRKDPDAMPVVGRTDIAVHWDGTPALVIKTTAVRKVRFCDVTEDMALAEGGYESLEEWREGREWYFEQSGGFKPDMMLVIESFDVVENLQGRELDPDEDTQ